MSDRLRNGATLAVAATICSLLVWQQLHGGVPAHNLLARADLPRISNWWGAVTLPVLTWFAMANIQGRVAHGRTTLQAAAAAGLGAAAYGAVLAASFALGIPDLPRWLLLATPLVALVVPVYRAEYLLGFTLAMSYTFGGVLPLVVGSVFALIGAAVHLGSRGLLRRLGMKL